MNKIYKLKFILLFTILFSLFTIPFSLLIAQSYPRDKNGQNLLSIEGLQYGFNFGAYFPGNKTANYYNGDSSHTLNLYRTLLERNYVVGNQYYMNGNYDTIRNRLFHGNDFTIKELPHAMKYSVTINIGFYTKYNFNDNLGIYFEVNYAKLKTTDMISIDAASLPQGSFVVPYFYPILGKESRVDIDFGMMKAFGTPRVFKPYVEAAFNLNDTRVLSADVNMGNYTYSYLNPFYVQYGLRDDGIGYGFVFGGGVQTIFTTAIVLYTGFDITYKKIHLGDYTSFNPNGFLYVRLLFRGLISTKPD